MLEGSNIGIVDRYGYERLFDYGINNTYINGVMVNYVILVIALILFVSPIEVSDQVNNVSQLYMISVEDERKVHVAKHLTALFYVIIITLVFSLWKYDSISQYYILNGGLFNIASVPSLSKMLNGMFSLNESYYLVAFIRFLVLLLMAEMIMYFSKNSTSLFSTVIKSVLILLLPLGLLYFRFEFIEPYLLSYYFTSSDAYIINAFSVVKFLCIILLILIFVYFNIKKQNK